VIKLAYLAITALKYGFVGLKFSKLLFSGGTMLLSLVIYASIFGWRYAAGFIALLFAHEMGHFAAARQRGLDVGLPTFIPFIGAWIALKEMPMNAETEAYIAVAGPFVGTLASFLCYFIAREHGSNLLLAVSYSGFFLNLFNLLPVSPLDGGRITGVLSPRIWLLGAPALVALMIYMPSPALVMVLILAIPQLIRAWNFQPNAPENIAYYSTSAQTRLEYGALYLGLVALLGLMTVQVHEMLTGRF
jgi:Zn-dependent protease